MTKSDADEAAIRIRLVPLDELRPNPRNARKHPPEQVEQIAASIREFGFTNPILADLHDDGMIAAGHGRRLAILKLFGEGVPLRLPNGRELPLGVVPVIDCSGWTEAQRRAYTLADNQLALSSEWDEDLLSIELGELREEGFAVDLIGFSAKEIDKLLAAAAEATPPDEFPSYGEDIETEHQCPKCGYQWSGKAS